MIPAGLLPEVIAVAPDAAGGAARPRTGPDSQQWQREFERAQISGWLTTTPTRSEPPTLAVLPGLFHANAVAAAVFVAPDAAGAQAQQRMQSLVAEIGKLADVDATWDVAARREQAAPMPGAVVAGERRNQQAAAVRTQSPAETSAWWPTTAQPPKSAQLAASRTAPVVEARAATANAAAPVTPQPPVRLHAEWSAEGVRLWLALDANVQHQLSAITQQVRRWMFAQGVQVIEFSCNGRPLEDAAHTEEPWPSAP